MSTGRVCFLSFVMILALAASPAFAQQNGDARVLKLTLVQGDVQVNPNTGAGWEQAINNRPVTGGSRIWAAVDSTAVIQLEDGSTIRLVGPAEIVLSELSLAPNGAPVDRVEVDAGQVLFDADLPAHADFRIQDLDGNTFVLTEASRLNFEVGDQTGLLFVRDGEVQALDAPGQPVFHAGESYYYALHPPQ